jgi:hypothetical protein
VGEESRKKYLLAMRTAHSDADIVPDSEDDMDPNRWWWFPPSDPPSDPERCNVIHNQMGLPENQTPRFDINADGSDEGTSSILNYLSLYLTNYALTGPQWKDVGIQTENAHLTDGREPVVKLEYVKVFQCLLWMTLTSLTILDITREKVYSSIFKS